MTVARTIEPARAPLRGRVRVPGDKSIAHRAIMFNGAARGRASIEGLPDGEDVWSTVAAMRALGCRIEEQGDGLVVEGAALAFARPAAAIDCGNSGTTMRLLTGLLAGQPFDCTLTGDASLARRPMERVAAPLRAMGARVDTTDGHAPVVIGAARLTAVEHRLEVASAQVKTALLLAGLQASGRTTVHEPRPSRDHTERMLAAMGLALERDGSKLQLDGPCVPTAVDVTVCGDASSAAFFAVAASIVAGSHVTIEDVCLNPTRTGFVELLRRMGASIHVDVRGERAGEPYGDLSVRAASLRAIEIGGADVPGAIDELPVLAVAAACASGHTVISGAGELRVKESDRIASVTSMLARLGIEVEERDDGMVIHGGRLGADALIETRADHRLVMSGAVAALAAGGAVRLDDASPAAVSFPGFFESLEGLRT